MAWMEMSAYVSAARFSHTSTLVLASVDSLCFLQPTKVGDLVHFVAKVRASRFAPLAPLRDSPVCWLRSVSVHSSCFLDSVRPCVHQGAFSTCSLLQSDCLGCGRHACEVHEEGVPAPKKRRLTDLPLAVSPGLGFVQQFSGSDGLRLQVPQGEENEDSFVRAHCPAELCEGFPFAALTLKFLQMIWFETALIQPLPTAFASSKARPPSSIFVQESRRAMIHCNSAFMTFVAVDPSSTAPMSVPRGTLLTHAMSEFAHTYAANGLHSGALSNGSAPSPPYAFFAFARRGLVGACLPTGPTSRPLSPRMYFVRTARPFFSKEQGRAPHMVILV